MQDIQTTYFPQVEKVFSVGVINLYFKMYDIQIVEARYQPNNTNLLISQTKPNVRVNLEDCDFDFTFKYILKSTPELIDDLGTAKAWFTDLNMSFKASPVASKAAVQFEFDELQSNVKDFGVEMKGGDVSNLINNFSDVLEEFVRSYLIGKMSD